MGGRGRRLVYFAQRADGTGPIKIGSSSCPRYRVKQIGFDHADKFIVLVEGEGGLAAERQLHRDFAYCRAVVQRERLRRTGRVSIIPGMREWYHPVPELLQLIDNLKSGRIALSQVDARDNEIARRWLRGETLQSIGNDYGITRERVRQIVASLKLRREWRKAA